MRSQIQLYFDLRRACTFTRPLLYKGQDTVCNQDSTAEKNEKGRMESISKSFVYFFLDWQFIMSKVPFVFLFNLGLKKSSNFVWPVSEYLATVFSN